MAVGDISLYSEQASGITGGQIYNVAASATLIYAGEPVGITALGDTVVIPMATNQPAINTHLAVGVAQTTSTNTASAAGIVTVAPVSSKDIWLISPKAPTSWDTQAEYDALVGKRVLLDLTAGSYTILASDSANNGCIIRALDISKHPGKVAFSFADGANFLNA